MDLIPHVPIFYLPNINSLTDYLKKPMKKLEHHQEENPPNNGKQPVKERSKSKPTHEESKEQSIESHKLSGNLKKDCFSVVRRYIYCSPPHIVYFITFFSVIRSYTFNEIKINNWREMAKLSSVCLMLLLKSEVNSLSPLNHFIEDVDFFCKQYRETNKQNIIVLSSCKVHLQAIIASLSNADYIITCCNKIDTIIQIAQEAYRQTMNVQPKMVLLLFYYILQRASKYKKNDRIINLVQELGHLLGDDNKPNREKLYLDNLNLSQSTPFDSEYKKEITICHLYSIQSQDEYWREKRAILINDQCIEILCANTKKLCDEANGNLTEQTILCDEFAHLINKKVFAKGISLSMNSLAAIISLLTNKDSKNIAMLYSKCFHRLVPKDCLIGDYISLVDVGKFLKDPKAMYAFIHYLQMHPECRVISDLYYSKFSKINKESRKVALSSQTNDDAQAYDQLHKFVANFINSSNDNECTKLITVFLKNEDVRVFDINNLVLFHTYAKILKYKKVKTLLDAFLPSADDQLQQRIRNYKAPQLNYESKSNLNICKKKTPNKEINQFAYLYMIRDIIILQKVLNNYSLETMFNTIKREHSLPHYIYAENLSYYNQLIPVDLRLFTFIRALIYPPAKSINIIIKSELSLIDESIRQLNSINLVSYYISIMTIAHCISSCASQSSNKIDRVIIIQPSFWCLGCGKDILLRNYAKQWIKCRYCQQFNPILVMPYSSEIKCKVCDYYLSFYPYKIQENKSVDFSLPYTKSSKAIYKEFILLYESYKPRIKEYTSKSPPLVNELYMRNGKLLAGALKMIAWLGEHMIKTDKLVESKLKDLANLRFTQMPYYQKLQFALGELL